MKKRIASHMLQIFTFFMVLSTSCSSLATRIPMPTPTPSPPEINETAERVCETKQPPCAFDESEYSSDQLTDDQLQAVFEYVENYGNPDVFAGCYISEDCSGIVINVVDGKQDEVVLPEADNIHICIVKYSMAELEALKEELLDKYKDDLIHLFIDIRENKVSVGLLEEDGDLAKRIREGVPNADMLVIRKATPGVYA